VQERPGGCNTEADRPLLAGADKQTLGQQARELQLVAEMLVQLNGAINGIMVTAGTFIQSMGTWTGLLITMADGIASTTLMMGTTSVTSANQTVRTSPTQENRGENSNRHRPIVTTARGNMMDLAQEPTSPKPTHTLGMFRPCRFSEPLVSNQGNHSWLIDSRFSANPRRASMTLPAMEPVRWEEGMPSRSLDQAMRALNLSPGMHPATWGESM
jgi:hypothetical protein